MSSITDISPVGLPVSLKYDQLPSISDAVSNYQVFVSPSGITQVGPVSTDTLGGTPFVRTSIGFVNTSFPSTNLDFQIPSGHNENVFLDTRETFLTFRLVLNRTTALNGPVGIMNLISSASSFFSSLTLFSNNVPVETIYNYDILYNQLLNATVNVAERYGPFGISQGCDVDSHTGINLAAAGAAPNLTYYTFTIPLISIIGLNTAGVSNKLFPVGSIGNLLLRLQTTPLLPFSSTATDVAIAGGGQAVYQITLDSFN